MTEEIALFFAEELTAWLIELRRETPTYWGDTRNEPGSDGVTGWTRDHFKAMRFARKADAELLIAEYGWTDAFATEHRWCDYSHKWSYRERYGFTSCDDCGVVQRPDGKNSPCRGRVSVGPRAQPMTNDDPNSELIVAQTTWKP